MKRTKYRVVFGKPGSIVKGFVTLTSLVAAMLKAKELEEKGNETRIDYI